jgi:PAS domain S-box-containing protein
MVDTGSLTWPVMRRNDFIRIVMYIALATIFIFIIDIITPLGVMIWIIYLIPLFLTVYLSWKYAPLVMTGVFILLMTASLFLSPRDISIEYAVLNRAFFALILIITSIFIEDYISNVEDLALSEERYRHLIEWSPEGIIVVLQGKIAYVNPVGIRSLGADRRETLIGSNIIELIDPEWQEIFRQRFAQASIGAQMNIDKIGIVRKDASRVSMGLDLAPVVWNRVSAIQIVMKKT